MKDWQGKEVPNNEDPDSEILIWVLTSFAESGTVDEIWIRGYQDMVIYAKHQMESIIDNLGEEELKEGHDFNVKLKTVTLKEYQEAIDND